MCPLIPNLTTYRSRQTFGYHDNFRVRVYHFRSETQWLYLQELYMITLHIQLVVDSGILEFGILLVHTPLQVNWRVPLTLFEVH